MKELIIIFLFLSSIIVNGQTTKNLDKTGSQPKTTLKVEDIIKLKAEKWFETVYVENVFKDPYSYKLLKTTVTPKNMKEALIDSIAKISSIIETTNLSSEEKLPKTRVDYQAKYDASLAEIEKNTQLAKETTDSFDANYYAKKNVLLTKIASLLNATLLKIDKYNLNIIEMELLERRLNKLQPEQSKQLGYYEIRIDCYSNNSLGNQVLGRFCFPFTKNGTIGSNNGMDSVIKLN